MYRPYGAYYRFANVFHGLRPWLTLFRRSAALRQHIRRRSAALRQHIRRHSAAPRQHIRPRFAAGNISTSREAALHPQPRAEPVDTVRILNQPRRGGTNTYDGMLYFCI